MRTEILFDREGTPLAFASDKIFGVTQAEKRNEEPKEVFSVGEREFAAWGPDNRYPEEAVRIIGSTGVLSTAIGFKSRTSFGQGVIPMEMTGYDDSGEPVLAASKDVALHQYLKGYAFRNYMATAFRDLFKFGNCFPIFYFNAGGKQIVRTVLRNARHCRVSKDKGALLVFPNFDESQPSKETCEIIAMLDEDDPFYDLEQRRLTGKLHGQPVAFPRIKNYYSNNDYYGIPDWDAAYRSGWVSVANKIPRFLERSYANAMTLMWHIQIPKSYWTENFPKNDYKTPQERQDAINAYMDSLEDSLCGDENTSKTFISSFDVGMNGKAEEKWSIERLANEIDAKERLSTSAAANSEILFSMMINPSVLGAGMPGGSYAGNTGSGSDIRESFLVSVITTYIEKQQVLDPIYMMLRYNDKKNENLTLKYKDTILTTLNTGQSQEEVTT